MDGLTPAWKQIHGWCAQHRAELRLTVRICVSAMLALVIAHLLQLPLALWTVLTAVILTQISVGGSLKATGDYLASTVGGGVYAAVVNALVPHEHEIATLATLALAVAPPALVAATNPRFRAAPFTAVMVFFAPGITHAGPIESAFERVIQVAIGAVVGLVVSLVVLPARALELVIEVASRMLTLMAGALPELLAGCTQPSREAAVRRIQDSLGSTLLRVTAIAPELRQEQMTGIAGGPDSGPLLRTLLRLRHDLVMIGRAAIVPLPESLRTPLGSPIGALAETAAEYLAACAAALTSRQSPPKPAKFEEALRAFNDALAAARQKGLTRELTNEELERLFALGFTLEQMHLHLIDLDRCLQDFARGTAS
jgi:uncharacterized membrane protein YccC